ncbi:MAG: hypothetical protein NT009_05995 [Proteobacteria bacterium]|jgi:hypothetical protein|nr:hypothetical protein [Pseudomonadota bacterium]
MANKYQIPIKSQFLNPKENHLIIGVWDLFGSIWIWDFGFIA